MPQFSDILSQIQADAEERTRAARSPRLNTSGWDSWMAPDGPPEGQRTAQPNRDYIAVGPPPASEPAPAVEVPPPLPKEPAPAPLDLATELAEARLQGLSVPELQALRRRLAGHLHPDLAPRGSQSDADAMTQVNVTIDAAIRRRLALRGA